MVKMLIGSAVHLMSTATALRVSLMLALGFSTAKVAYPKFPLIS
jgi:hypothetical protein